MDDVAAARSLVGRARRIAVLSGAGISTDSGIPDFRGPNGVWTRDPTAERLATLDAYMGDPHLRQRAWRNRLESPTWGARPNTGHRALVTLEQQDRLDTLVTQNIDGLHQAAGSDPTKVIEIHGTVRDVVCMRCGDRSPAGPTLARVRQGDLDPRCRAALLGEARCGGILKSATISFGQQLVAADLQRAEAAAADCDLFLAVGTSLGVYPAAGLVPLAAASGAPVIVMNGEPTPFDDVATVVLRGPISTVLASVVGRD